MKRKLHLIVLLAVCCLMTAAIGCNAAADSGTGSGSGKPGTRDDDILIKQLIVDTPPTRTEYFEGQNFDATGMVIKAVWFDDFVETLSKSDYTIEGGENLTPDVNKVAVYFEDGKVDVPVTVKEFLATSIEIAKMPLSVTQLTESKFDFSGLEVYASNGTEEIEVKNYSLFVGEKQIDKENAELNPGNNVVTVKYKELTADFKVKYVKGFRIEFENILKTADLSGSEKNFVEKTNSNYPFKEMESDEAHASAGRYMGYVQKDDVLRLHVDLKEKSVVNIVIAAASNNVSQYKKAYYPDAKDWWLPVEVAPTSFYDSFAVTVNSVEVPSDASAILPGCVALDEEGEINKNGDANIMLNWARISLGEFELDEGDNIIDIKCINKIAANFDYAEIRYIPEHSHDESTLDKIEATAPTCAGKGNVEYYICSVCDKTYSDFSCDNELKSVEIEKLPHTLEKIEIVTPPTNVKYALGEKFDTTGLMVKAYCSKCGTGRYVTDSCTFSAIKAGDTFVTISYTEGGVTKTCEQAIQVINEYGVEAEYTVNWWESKYFNPSQSGEYKIFVDKTGSKVFTSDTASGGGYFALGGTNASSMKIYLWSDVETEVTLVLRASSASADKVAADYGETDEYYKWTPVVMKDIALKNGYSLTYRYDQNGTKISATYLDTAVVQGETALNDDGTINEKGDTSLYSKWKDVEVAKIPLKRGANIIVFEKLSDDYAVNIDRIYLRF